MVILMKASMSFSESKLTADLWPDFSIETVSNRRPDLGPLCDFRNFLYIVWKHLNLPDPTPLQYDVATSLQHGPKRLIIEAFRGVGKSWVTSAFVCWLLLVDPQIKVLVVSASKSRSDDFAIFTKRLIRELPVLQHLMAKAGQRDSNVSFDVGPAEAAHAPSVKSLGITSQLAGSRAEVIIADDVEVPNNSFTQAMRDKLANAVKEFDAVLSPKPASRVVYLGTPQCEMSLYNVLAERGYTVMVWPVEYPDGTLLENLKGRLAPFIQGKLDRDPSLVGQSTEPTRFDTHDLMARKASYGTSGYALQFLLDTTLSDADKYPLKLSDFMVFDVDPTIAPVKLKWGSGPEQIFNDLVNVGLTGDKWLRPMYISGEFSEYQGAVLYIDPSGRGSDETGYSVTKMLNSYIYVPAWGGMKGGYEDATLEALARVAKDHKVKMVRIESNFGDGMYTKLFAPWLLKVGYPCTIEEIHSVGQKELRIIDTLEPVLNQHRLVLDKKIIELDSKVEQKYQGLYQLTRITKARGALGKDDRIEALAGGVAYWTELMDKETDQSEKEHIEKLRQLDLEKFMAGVLGTPVREPNWMGLN